MPSSQTKAVGGAPELSPTLPPQASGEDVGFTGAKLQTRLPSHLAGCVTLGSSSLSFLTLNGQSQGAAEGLL